MAWRIYTALNPEIGRAVENENLVISTRLLSATEESEELHSRTERLLSRALEHRSVAVQHNGVTIGDSRSHVTVLTLIRTAKGEQNRMSIMGDEEITLPRLRGL